MCGAQTRAYLRISFSVSHCMRGRKGHVRGVVFYTEDTEGSHKVVTETRMCRCKRKLGFCTGI